ncbi:hypothetical protein AB7813_03645 [Tardiphaga sp. 20_F10_N6_6]|uniref:hypothetical protein n=1 Tax=Tardiphaga sp. 20_F10_N6_6 TaxID=3240788 RepID=UPI003F8C7100
MSEVSAESAYDAALAYLLQHPWVADKEASNRSYRFNLMCEAGLDFVDDASTPMEGRVLYSGDHPERLIELAGSGDRIAHEALCEIAAHRTGRNLSLPLALQAYVVRAAMTPPNFRQGSHAVSHLHRDEAIFAAVELMISRGLRPTRNRASTGPCACSIVSEALSECRLATSELNVASIWRKRCKTRQAAGFRISSDVQN